MHNIGITSGGEISLTPQLYDLRMTLNTPIHICIFKWVYGMFYVVIYTFYI